MTLDELKALLEKVQNRPWKPMIYATEAQPRDNYVESSDDIAIGYDCEFNESMSADEARLICAAVNALPWLMEKLQEARDLLDEVKDDPHPTGARQWLADVERGCP